MQKLITWLMVVILATPMTACLVRTGPSRHSHVQKQNRPGCGQGWHWNSNQQRCVPHNRGGKNR